MDRRLPGITDVAEESLLIIVIDELIIGGLKRLLFQE